MSDYQGAPQPDPAQQPQQGYAYPPAPGYYPQPVFVQQRPTSGLAVASFVLALVWGLGFTSLLAVILAIPAMRETKTGEKGGHGFAVAGLVIGLLGFIPTAFVVLSWVGLFAAGVAGSATS